MYSLTHTHKNTTDPILLQNALKLATLRGTSDKAILDANDHPALRDRLHHALAANDVRGLRALPQRRYAVVTHEVRAAGGVVEVLGVDLAAWRRLPRRGLLGRVVDAGRRGRERLGGRAALEARLRRVAAAGGALAVDVHVGNCAGAPRGRRARAAGRGLAPWLALRRACGRARGGGSPLLRARG